MTPRQQLITLWGLLKRQAVQMVYNYVYILCMVVFPLLCTFFFADLMKNGLPTDMPAGAVDLDQQETRAHSRCHATHQCEENLP